MRTSCHTKNSAVYLAKGRSHKTPKIPLPPSLLALSLQHYPAARFPRSRTVQNPTNFSSVCWRYRESCWSHFRIYERHIISPSISSSAATKLSSPCEVLVIPLSRAIFLRRRNLSHRLFLFHLSFSSSFSLRLYFSLSILIPTLCNFYRDFCAT